MESRAVADSGARQDRRGHAFPAGIRVGAGGPAHLDHEASCRPESRHFGGDALHAFLLRQAAEGAAHGRDPAGASFAFSEKNRVGHAVPVFRNERVCGAAVRTADDEGGPGFTARARPYGDPRARKEKRQIHLLEKPGVGNEHQVEIPGGPVTTASRGAGEDRPRRGRVHLHPAEETPCR